MCIAMPSAADQGMPCPLYCILGVLILPEPLLLCRGRKAKQSDKRVWSDRYMLCRPASWGIPTWVHRYPQRDQFWVPRRLCCKDSSIWWLRMAQCIKHLLHSTLQYLAEWPEHACNTLDPCSRTSAKSTGAQTSFQRLLYAYQDGAAIENNPLSASHISAKSSI